MVTIKRGDIFGAKEKIIAHQVNCQGAAGGLAAYVFERYPDAKNDYHQLIQRTSRAGVKTRALLGRSMLTGQQKDGHVIANLFGQYYPGQDYRPDALRYALSELSAQAKAIGCGVALPYKISCGLCGGDWDEVQKIIEETMDGVDCAIYQREGDK